MFLTNRATKRKIQPKPVSLEPVAEKKKLAVTQRDSRPPKTVILIDQSNFYHACEDLSLVLFVALNSVDKVGLNSI